MKSLTLAALTAAAFGLAATLPAHTAGPQPLHLAQAKAAQAHKGSGVVKSVNAHAGVVKLDHGPIPSLGWGAMAMDFKVKDHNLLKDLKPGQKVEFDLVSEGPGQFLITRISPAQ
jgi:Cu/Ag efflux protein CusF